MRVLSNSRGEPFLEAMAKRITRMAATIFSGAPGDCEDCAG
jgi:hypothetical protein